MDGSRTPLEQLRGHYENGDALRRTWAGPEGAGVDGVSVNGLKGVYHMGKTTNYNHTNEGGATTCCICGREIVSPEGTTIGQNNPWPIVLDGSSVCCAECNGYVVSGGYVPGYVFLSRMYANDRAALRDLADMMEADGCTDRSVAGVRKLAVAKHISVAERKVVW